MSARAIGLILGMTALTGCGSSATSPPATPNHAAASIPAASLRLFTVQGGEEPGFTPQDTAVHPTASSFVVGESSSTRAQTDIARLNREGFRGGAIETLAVNSGQQGGGVSAVIVLGSTAAARRELAVELQDIESTQGAGAIISHFTVPSIATARGFSATQPSQGGAGNVLFIEGSCLLVVGDSGNQSELSTPLIQAAERIDTRTHGTCP